MIRGVDPLQSIRSAQTTAPGPRAQGAAGSFAEALDRELKGVRPVKFSAHAQQRLDSRNVTLTGDDRLRLDKAVDELATKGSRESLVLMDRMALVVSVPNRTVITVVPQAEAGNNIFTHIDSAVVVPKDGASRQA